MYTESRNESRWIWNSGNSIKRMPVASFTVI